MSAWGLWVLTEIGPPKIKRVVVVETGSVAGRLYKGGSDVWLPG